MKNKLIIIISFIIVLALSGFVVFKLFNNNDYEGNFYDGDNQTEIVVPTYDVGQYIPEDNTVQKDITITITNLDDFDIPEQASLENELNYFARTSNYFNESCEVELEYFEEDLDNTESAKVYLFKIKDTDVHGSFIDEAFVFDFWIE